MRQNVLNLTVVLADGTILKTAQRARKSSAGYNLTYNNINAHPFTPPFSFSRPG
jgi:FAD/FMN-containing dehydrogenase